MTRYFCFMGCLLFLVFLLAWVVLYRPGKEDTMHSVIAAPPVHALDEFLRKARTSHDLKGNLKLTPTLQFDITGRNILADSQFWLLFATVFILVGSLLFVMTNIAFIVGSLGSPMEQVSTMVVLFSVGNYCGRVVASIILDSVLEHFPRIYFVSVAAILVGAIHTPFLAVPRSYLAVPITLAGIADCVMFSSFPILTRETFGVHHLGENFCSCWCAMAPTSTLSLFRRGCSLLAGMLLMLGVGSTYALSAWNAQLKTLLHFSQAEISMVSAMTMLGSYLSYIPGVMFDRLGPYTSVLVSGSAMLSVHIAIFAALQFAPESVSALGLGCAMMLFGLLSSFCVFSSIVPNESLFGDANRGKVMAALTSSYSCGGAFFAFVFHTGFQNDGVPGYFLFVGNYLLAACVFGWCMFSRPVAGEINLNKKERSGSVEFGEGTAGVTADCQPTGDSEKTSDLTGVALLTDLRFWMLFIPVMIIIGSGLLVMSNVSFIVESLYGPKEQIPLMVAMFSILNAFGRLMTGAVSDLLLTRYPRAYFAGLSVLLTAITQIVFLTAPPSWLLLAVAMAGFSEGVMFGTFPVIIREEFGLQHFGKNFGLMSLANCIGYPLFFSPLASYVYQRSATTYDGDSVQKCFGAHCFGPVFVVAIVLSVVAFVCCIQLARMQHRRRFYIYQQIRP
ncbi:hypothetical protein BBO99_00005756 [Phytophthora kernoviae]|uniref:Major facilitator superfamily (MFS) profile domain-containing protein n=1 Tax=Phytophthora kernoviae TaxID=325452 RepID=A0A421FIL0_9STRA|nr:hypothetical protein BBI17_005768 [Phytophthora kernoviae]RLN78733.1 hypothetical protein BBO99_00005756 [Phytophthora kernoviae]